MIKYDVFINEYDIGNHKMLYDMMNMLRRLIILLNIWLQTGLQDDVNLNGVYWDVDTCHISEYDFDDYINCLMNIFIKHMCIKLSEYYTCGCSFKYTDYYYFGFIQHLYTNMNIQDKKSLSDIIHEKLILINPYCTLKTYTENVAKMLCFIKENLIIVSCKTIPLETKSEKITIKITKSNIHDYHNRQYLYNYKGIFHTYIPTILTLKNKDIPTCEMIKVNNNCVICDCEYIHVMRSMAYSYDTDMRMCNVCINTFTGIIPHNAFGGCCEVVFAMCMPLLRNYNKIILLIKYFNNIGMLFRDIVFNVMGFVKLVNQ